MEKIDIAHAAEHLGYSAKGHGYSMETKENTHWISVLGNRVQLYGYFSEDDGFEKAYDTGEIALESIEELKIIATALIRNHI